MDYKFKLETQPDGKFFACEANINLNELKKDLPRIIARDKDFVNLIVISIITSKKFGETMEHGLALVKREVKFKIESRDGLLRYSKHGSLRDLTICFATAFAAQPTLRSMFFELVEDHIGDVCPCDNCAERRKNENSPGQVKNEMEKLIADFKKKNGSGVN